MKYQRYCIIGIFALLFAIHAKGQDVVFNHPYSGMLYANPAYTGIFGPIHIGATYRNQYTTSPSPYLTYYTEADVFIDKWNCGFGAYLLNTKAAGGQLVETAIGLSYMFHLKVTDELTFRPALQAVYHNKQRDFQSYTFPDRIDITGTAIPLGPQDYEPYNINNIDFAAGVIAQYRQFEVGLSAQHLGAQAQNNEPAVPFKLLTHAKYVFNLNAKGSVTEDISLKNWNSFNELKLIPYLQFIYQSNYQYITGGTIVQSGALFAGIGIKTALQQDVINLSLSGGFVTSNLRIGYSMDFIALGNTLQGWSGISHEVFMHITFGTKEGHSSNKWRKQSTCGCYL